MRTSSSDLPIAIAAVRISSARRRRCLRAWSHVSVINEPAYSLPMFNSDDCGIIARRSGRFGYMLSVFERHNDNSSLPSLKVSMTASVHDSAVPSSGRIDEERVIHL